jgi:hypothetical protein
MRLVLPVTKIATGFIVVFAAFRFNGFDLLLDPVGWGLCAAGLVQLGKSLDDPFNRVAISAVTMVCVSFVALIAPVASDSIATSPITHLIGLANALGALVTVWLAVDAVIGRIRTGADTSMAGSLDLLRWAVAGLGLLGTLAGYGYATLGQVTLIAWFAAVVALVIALYRSARLPCLSPTWEPAAG